MIKQMFHLRPPTVELCGSIYTYNDGSPPTTSMRFPSSFTSRIFFLFDAAARTVTESGFVFSDPAFKIVVILPLPRTSSELTASKFLFFRHAI